MDDAACTIRCAANEIIKKPFSSDKIWERRFRSHFGTTVSVAAQLWGMVRVPQGSNPKHLLFCLLFLKRYDCEEASSALCQVDECPFRKWAWYYNRQIAELEVVSAYTLLLPTHLHFRLIGIGASKVHDLKFAGSVSTVPIFVSVSLPFSTLNSSRTNFDQLELDTR